MALERDVSIDGIVYGTHTIQTMEHNYAAGQTIVGVLSEDGEGHEVTTFYAFDLAEGITLDDAYALIADRDEFAEVEDTSAALADRDQLIADMAALLTADQLAEVAGRLGAVGVATGKLDRGGDATIQPITKPIVSM